MGSFTDNDVQLFVEGNVLIGVPFVVEQHLSACTFPVDETVDHQIRVVAFKVIFGGRAD